MAVKTGNIFLDTNILIYAYSNTELEKKKKILSILTTESVVVSTQVINEFVWVMNRKFNVDFDSLKIIIDNIFDLYKVCIVSQPSIKKLLTFQKNLSFLTGTA